MKTELIKLISENQKAEYFVASNSLKYPVKQVREYLKLLDKMPARIIINPDNQIELNWGNGFAKINAFKIGATKIELEDARLKLKISEALKKSEEKRAKKEAREIKLAEIEAKLRLQLNPQRKTRRG